jgi:hypothetical protein
MSALCDPGFSVWIASTRSPAATAASLTPAMIAP